MDNLSLNETEVKQNEMKKYYTKAALRLIALWAGWIVFQIVWGILISVLSAFPIFEKYMGEINMASTIVIDVLLFVLMYFVMLKNEKSIPEKKKMPFGKWFLILLCGYFFAIMGNIVGTVVNGALLMPFGYNFNNINQSMEIMKSMSNLSGFIFELLTVGIMGPVMEELLFRKMFIDNYSKYGMGAAILASAVSFGLFHGNFSQFFMATALGILFGYVYSLTGNIMYTIAMHVTINVYNVITGFATLAFYDEEFNEKLNNIVSEFMTNQDLEAYLNAINNLIENEPTAVIGMFVTSAVSIIEVLLILVCLILVICNIRKFLRFRKTLYLGEKGAKTYAMLNVGMIICYVFAGFLLLLFYGSRILESPMFQDLIKI